MADVSVKEKVVTELRARKIKLWQSPYCENGISKDVTLKHLSTAWTKRNGIFSVYQEQDVFIALKELQIHAMKKLANKEKSTESKTTQGLPNIDLEMKVFGRKKIGSFPHEWEKQVEIEDDENGITKIKLRNVPANQLVLELIEILKTSLNVLQVRLLHKGNFLKYCESETLGSQLLLQSSNSKEAVSNQSNKNVTVKLMCLASGEADMTSIDVATSVSSSSTTSPEEKLIKSIRRAADRLHNSSGFEITDQHGRHVAMSKENRVSFLTALGLHRLGRKHMEEGNLPSALTFLLEADLEWRKGGEGLHQEWGSRVDNYGLLQLDICWVYLKIESLSALPDVLRRLVVAERVLKRQVHKNFLPLALAQAENGNVNAVPPLAAIFVRLFLLQAVAYKYDNGNTTSQEKSKESLDSAFILCQSLRSVTSEEAVARLGEAVGASKFAAISALRRSNGDVNIAAGLIESDETKSKEEETMRTAQRRIGLCANLADYVCIEKISQLKSILNLNGGRACDTMSSANSINDMMVNLDLGTELAVGLLRLANNDIEEAIDVYNEKTNDNSGFETILSQVAELDARLQQQGLMSSRLTSKSSSRKRLRRREQAVGEKDVPTVDDIALTTLVSMNIDETLGRKALQATDNNVEAALTWITTNTEQQQQHQRHQEQHSELSKSKHDEGTANDNSNANMDQDDANVASTKKDEESITMTPTSTTASKRRIEEAADANEETRLRHYRRYVEDMEAMALLERELGEALQEQCDIEKEYFGSTLDDEWDIINKYRSSL